MLNDRAVSEVIGAILVFALIISGLALAQVFLVPQGNQEAEFEHNQEAQSQMLDVRNAVQGAATGVPRSESVDLGAEYPNRMLLLNPEEGAGTIRTVGTTDPSIAIELQNVKATNTETDDWLDGSSESFSTGGLIYQPNYNFYSNAPQTVYENSVLYNRFAETGGTEFIPKTDQDLVEGRTISLTALDGEISTSESGDVAVDTRVLSPATRTVAVESDGGPITITVPTGLDQGTWEEILAAETCPDNSPADNDCDTNTGGHILADSISVDPVGETLTFELEEGVTYELEMAKVGVGNGFSDTSAHYITTELKTKRSATDNGAEVLTVEVRDRFNNPISGIAVPFEASDGTFEGSGTSTHTVETDENGKATVTYNPPDVASGASATVTVDAGAEAGSFEVNGVSGSQDSENVEFEMKVADAEFTAPQRGINLNPNQPGAVVLVDQSEVAPAGGGQGAGAGGGSTDVTITLDNKKSGSVDIVGGRMNAFIAGGPAGSAGTAPEWVIVHDEDGGVPTNNRFERAGEFESLDNPISLSTGETTIDLEFENEVVKNNFYVITLEYSDGTTGTYLISHPSSN